MPELPEVETVRRGLETAIAGKKIQRVTLRRQGVRIPFPPRFAEQLKGRKVESIARRAKYLLIHLENAPTLIAHLGMTGKFSVVNKLPRRFQKHDHAVFLFQGGGGMIFNDVRRFGLMTLCPRDALDTHPLLAHLGPEPMEEKFTAHYLRDALISRSAAIKPVLMDQQVVVGVGNIYASEALFEARINPRSKASTVARHAATLVHHIREVLKSALKSGGSSLRDFAHVDGETGYFQHQFKVYGREKEPCGRCGTPIRKIIQTGRATFFCPQCQK